MKLSSEMPTSHRYIGGESKIGLVGVVLGGNGRRGWATRPMVRCEQCYPMPLKKCDWLYEMRASNVARIVYVWLNSRRT